MQKFSNSPSCLPSEACKAKGGHPKPDTYNRPLLYILAGDIARKRDYEIINLCISVLIRVPKMEIEA